MNDERYVLLINWLSQLIKIKLSNFYHDVSSSQLQSTEQSQSQLQLQLQSQSQLQSLQSEQSHAVLQSQIQSSQSQLQFPSQLQSADLKFLILLIFLIGMSINIAFDFFNSISFSSIIILLSFH